MIIKRNITFLLLGLLVFINKVYAQDISGFKNIYNKNYKQINFDIAGNFPPGKSSKLNINFSSDASKRVPALKKSDNYTKNEGYKKYYNNRLSFERKIIKKEFLLIKKLSFAFPFAIYADELISPKFNRMIDLNNNDRSTLS